MRFLCDQNMERRVAAYLKGQGHDVKVGVIDYDGRLPDPDILALAHRERRILLTNDSDFGTLVWQHGHPHAGVIYFRMLKTSADRKIDRLIHVLAEYGDALDHFIVVTAGDVRVRRAGDEP